MYTLNEYSNRIAHIIGQPNNHSLKERIKILIKDYFAKYIIQSIDRNGIQDYYKLTLTMDVIPIAESKIINPLYDIEGHPKRYIYTEYKTVTNIPKPMNIKNDTPFTRVSLENSSRTFKYLSLQNYRISYNNPFTSGCFLHYTYNDNIIKIRRKFNSFTLQNVEVFTKIEVIGIWENPEEVIGFYSKDDNQDLKLPFPNEMMNFVIIDLLKTEFNIIPKDTDITKN